MAADAGCAPGDLITDTSFRKRVDLDRYRPAEDPARLRRELGWPEEGLLFLTLRRLVPRTGVDLLLEAFALVAADHPGANLVVAGSGPLLPELEAQVRRAGLRDRVRFTGYLEDELLPTALAAADAVVMPTRELEGLGLVTLEAMASGTVIAATPVGGNVELLEPFMPSLLAGQTTPEALARVLGGLAGRGREELRSMGLRARIHVQERYGWQRTTDDLARLVRSLP